MQVTRQEAPMEIPQIETFLAVATFGGFHRAAEALRVSQPAVSARIKALEESLGGMLFVRSRRGLTLSEPGRVLRPYAEQLLKTASIARQAVRQLNLAARRRCRLLPRSPFPSISCPMCSRHL